ncbi:hypothetical protein EC973_003927 [Apophysomyces ossiformis]|uniref:Uncharacterized protein n=1 Tax=Apophysomyces ossiformis TaxID=679940 RepID=A0A8H7ELR8_9FUNG|nr:hypothetical protein EC973_003927 [Apophysomyces ossiformis]
MYTYMTGPDADLQTELAKSATNENYYPNPKNFTLVQNAHNTTYQPTATNAPGIPTVGSASPSNSTGGSQLPSWAIAVICVASVLVAGSLAAIFWAARKWRKNKAEASMSGNEKLLIPGPTKPPGGIGDRTPQVDTTPITPAAAHRSADATTPVGAFMDNRDISSIHSSTPMILHASGSLRSSPVTQSPSMARSLQDPDMEKSPIAHIMQHPEAHHSSSILSSTDALMIADTFRQFMRKPEWTGHDEDEETENVELQGRQQEEKSRREGDGLSSQTPDIHIEDRSIKASINEEKPSQP